MGILDEAIREHLELKRSHGAEESELDGLQAEAFGPADRPDAVEAQTEVISPGSSLTTPAGEGDQLDKVFEATRAAGDTGETELPSGEATEATEAAETSDEEATVAEHVIPSPPPEATQTELPADDAIHEAGPPEPAAPSAPAADQDFDDVEGGDAGDALQRERLTLSGHPTEHYDVDAAIAEEEEIDILSESSLSDELDRALDGPEESGSTEPEPAAAAPVEPAAPAMPDEPASDEFETGLEDDVDDSEPEAEEAEAELEAEETEEGVEPAEKDEPAEDPDSDFFDQDDPLEATPDFLEETPEHDRLWFEQKPPKDFEFGD
ncbi:MAG: hypothetical protein JJE13_03715 [Thermoleophilia bacterium]|nr:hypothetical protein [Thermoleophilia bacterium]